MTTWLESIKARVEKATPGPWQAVPDIRPDVCTVWTADRSGGYGGYGQIVRDGRYGVGHNGTVHVAALAKYEDNESDAAFIAHSRADIPALLAVAEAAAWIPWEAWADFLQARGEGIQVLREKMRAVGAAIAPLMEATE